MNKTPLAVLVLALAVPAGAQVEEYKTLQTAVEASKAAEAAKAAARTLDSTVVAMNDGPEAGGRVTRLIEDKKITVALATQAEPAKTVVVDGKTSILISDALPAHPRVYAPLIAAEAAKLMYADLPACAERSYMRAATVARVFAELGGDFKALPVVDGDSVDAVKAAVAAWSADSQTALAAAGKADGVPSVYDLEASNTDPKVAAALETANGRFTAFLMDESAARREALAR